MIYADFFRNFRNYKILKKIQTKLNGGVIHINPMHRPKGAVLISYTILPFITHKAVHDGHTNRWECLEIANIFLNRGYSVDVIDWTNKTFLPQKEYGYFLDIHDNMERLAPLMNKDCVKILHLTTSQASFQNAAEKNRLADLKKRRGVSLKPRRQMVETRSISLADEVTILGNKTTASTYDSAKREIKLIPLSTTHEFPSPEKKEFDKIRGNFMWLGGSGMVHKGLDLVLEAFAQMPQYQLTVCGKVLSEEDFAKVYQEELRNKKNIRVVGLVDQGSQKFKDITDNSVALVYPSCSEGQSGAVVTAMHAGIIPIISDRSGVDVEGFGTTLKECSVLEIKEAVSRLANLPAEELRRKSVKTWNYARENHTRMKFSETYGNFINLLEKKYAK